MPTIFSEKTNGEVSSGIWRKGSVELRASGVYRDIRDVTISVLIGLNNTQRYVPTINAITGKNENAPRRQLFLLGNKICF